MHILPGALLLCLVEPCAPCCSRRAASFVERTPLRIQISFRAIAWNAVNVRILCSGCSPKKSNEKFVPEVFCVLGTARRSACVVVDNSPHVTSCFENFNAMSRFIPDGVPTGAGDDGKMHP